MQRRQFLHMSALAGLAASVPAGIRHARAASGRGAGLFVLVQARGGWDPRLVCDPTLDPDQNRACRGIEHAADIAYTPLVMTPSSTGLGEASAAELMCARDFYDTHGGRLLCVNGIDMGTTEHEVGSRALWQPGRRGEAVTSRLLDLAHRESEAEVAGRDPELLDLDRFTSHASLALTAHQSGMIDAVHLELGGFDTHGSHDQAQTRQLGKLYRGVDALLRDAAARGLDDRLTVLIASELGRAPRYDGPGRFAGKDHWPVTSAMLLGPGIEGGRTIGGTTPQLRAQPYEGAPLTPARVLAMAGA